MMAAGGSVMARLQQVRDPRRRQGRRYRLAGLLGMLVLAAVHGEGSLRGMWLWCQAHWERLAPAFDLWEHPRPPAYATLWHLLAQLDAEELGQALSGQGEAEGTLGLDGKTLRGSRREGKSALQVLTGVGQGYRQILAQRGVEGGEVMAAALALLAEMPVKGKVVTMDAGVMLRTVVKAIGEKGGGYLGFIKENHGELKEALRAWIEMQGGDRRAADHVQIDKGHGRLERREVWVVAAGELGAYLEQEYDWPAVQWCGLVRRYRRRLGQKEWESVTTTLWAAGGHLPWGEAAQVQGGWRGHWAIENAVFYVRDVSLDEDRHLT